MNTFTSKLNLKIKIKNFHEIGRNEFARKVEKYIFFKHQLNLKNINFKIIFVFSYFTSCSFFKKKKFSWENQFNHIDYVKKIESIFSIDCYKTKTKSKFQKETVFLIFFLNLKKLLIRSTLLKILLIKLNLFIFGDNQLLRNYFFVGFDIENPISIFYIFQGNHVIQNKRFSKDLKKNIHYKVSFLRPKDKLTGF